MLAACIEMQCMLFESPVDVPVEGMCGQVAKPLRWWVYGVRVQVKHGVCEVTYTGPAALEMGISAAIKDKFPDIREVKYLNE